MTDPNHQRPRFRAEHIGSLLRPPALKAAHRAWQRGAAPEDRYRAALDHAIDAAVALQEEAGLPVITDGELGRASWMWAFIDALDGFAVKDALFAFRDRQGGRHRFPTCYAEAPIRRVRPITVDDYQRVRGLTGRTVKVTMPSPSAAHFFRLQDFADRAVYPDFERFRSDLVAVYEAEIAALAAAGASYVQIDEVPLAMLCDVSIREQVRGAGEDPAALTGAYIDLINRALARRPPGMTVALHLCRGNFRARWLAEGGYEPVAERLFNELAVDSFLLEYDTARAGDFAPLRFLPADKGVVLGLISTKSPALESADALRRRIDEASRQVPIERLGLSPQCGFASVAGGNPLSEDDQKRKLALVVEVAEAVWG